MVYYVVYKVLRKTIPRVSLPNHVLFQPNTRTNYKKNIGKINDEDDWEYSLGQVFNMTVPLSPRCS